jgi:flagellum-specific ATP synthase
MTLHALQKRLREVDPVLRTGRVRKILPTHIEADGPSVPLGAICDVAAHGADSTRSFPAEVVRVDEDGIVLLPFEEGITTFSGALVRGGARPDVTLAGAAFLGRAIDALGRPADGKGDIRAVDVTPLRADARTPLDRMASKEILETGIRAIDGLLTFGKGQRVGVFAASGVGKTTFIKQVTRHLDADITILCLVGERGREVEAMWNEGLDDVARARTTLVAATSDQPAAMRVRAAYTALAMAEYWQRQGKHVLLLLDSVTRLAMAMREMGLAAGEPPTLRAYTPSVFAQLPKLIERCGAFKSGGAISAIVTVLSETDDIDDPISELMKSILDGHIILSRPLAEEGQFPAIDVCRSVSRGSEQIMSAQQRRDARQMLEWTSLANTSKTLVDAGLYTSGANPRLDRALDARPEIIRFLKQDFSERASLEDTTLAMQSLVEALHA